MFSFLYLYIIRIQLALCESGRFISTNDSLLSIFCETQFVMWLTLQYVFASIDVICFGWLFSVRCHAAYFHLSSSSVQRSICIGIYFAKHTSKLLQHTIYIYKDRCVRLVLLTSIVMSGFPDHLIIWLFYWTPMYTWPHCPYIFCRSNIVIKIMPKQIVIRYRL